MTNFNLLPPEVNVKSIRGPGSKPMRTAQAAWDGLAEELYSKADEWIAQIAAAKAVFEGGAAGRFMEAAGQYHTWLNGHAKAARANVEYLAHAIHIYDATVEGMVPTSSIVANRAAALTMKTTNLLGQFTHKIVELDRAYQEMWAQNAELMNTYQSAIFDIMGQAEREGITPAPLVIHGGSSRSSGYHPISSSITFDEEEKFS
ncbi:PPE family protein [Mycobacterium haemophilum]|uniref:PPE family protein n=1 Tax=Mycobacterium haemophilum TaxID=29311 RepID=UPI000AB8DAC7|nr:PPE family protein [Mycobacterium haemophilum]MCV7340032.1 PPE family protein [Mycobacterium haemophilum DSM 44634]